MTSIIRTRSSSRATTSRRQTSTPCFVHSTMPSMKLKATHRAEPCATGLRTDADRVAHVQPARRTAGDFGLGATALHPAGQGRCREPSARRTTRAGRRWASQCRLNEPRRILCWSRSARKSCRPKRCAPLMEAFAAKRCWPASTNARLAHGEARAYGSPRRLAVIDRAISPSGSRTGRVEQKGPPTNIALRRRRQTDTGRDRFRKKMRRGGIGPWPQPDRQGRVAGRLPRSKPAGQRRRANARTDRGGAPWTCPFRAACAGARPTSSLYARCTGSCCCTATTVIDGDADGRRCRQ